MGRNKNATTYMVDTPADATIALCKELRDWFSKNRHLAVTDPGLSVKFARNRMRSLDIDQFAPYCWTAHISLYMVRNSICQRVHMKARGKDFPTAVNNLCGHIRDAKPEHFTISNLRLMNRRF